MTVTPMFPLQSVLLPGQPLSLRLFEPRYLELLADCVAGNRTFGVVLIERGSEVGGGETRNDVGTLARIVAHRRVPGGALIACVGTERFRVTRWLPDDPYPRAEIDLWPDTAPPSEQTWVRALERFEESFNRYWDVYNEAVFNSTGRTAHPDDHREAFGPYADDPPDEYTFGKAATLPIGDVDRYRALCSPDPIARVDVLIDAIDDALPAYRLRMLGDTP